MYEMNIRHVSANETRIPELAQGEAIVVNRYGESNRKAVILHPDDFDLLQRYRRMFGERVPYDLRLTDTAIAAHTLGERGADEPDLDSESLAIALSE
jgi:hypothetical protein